VNDRSTAAPIPPDGLGLRTTHAEDAIELVLSGELDLSRAATLNAEFARALERLAHTGDTPQRLIVDLQDLSFIDSSGIQVLVATKRRCMQRGIEVSLRLGDSQVRRMLNLAGVSEFLGLD
jgi:anti-anti-sigma factor